ncbi:hypothetical protein TSOC_002655 [Tetrabaena socialis]|uniref:Uncharacterized protein n=1 Tax=Tetrabaena socialis TaxID=47790 RepID=A0A2J8ADL3_9CHLO|nr:hypothetical protein TSOC_002655 [Tetrabaena socialis]|eukprot:PNH10604.1 hypothetical protein TSOC_002655 [Tetrabaena socialis]
MSEPRIYPSRFPDQPELSLLLRLRGDDSPAADWPAMEHNTTAPPVGRGPDAVASFIRRAMACRTVAPMELIVVLSGSQALAQATTWAWQAWQTEGAAAGGCCAARGAGTISMAHESPALKPVRRSALEEVGGFDEDLPQGDEPCSSYIRRDLTARLWKSGWRVGAHDMGMLQRPLADATVAQSNDPTRCAPEVAALSLHLLEARHGPLPPAAASPAPMEVLMARVRELNMRELALMAPNALATCPMQQGCNA